MNLRSILRQPMLTVAIHEREARWTLGGSGRITASGQVQLPPGFVDDGVILDSAAAGLVLRETRDFPGSRRMQVALALPAQRSVLRQLELPPLRGKQFAELVQREIRREMPMLADNAYVSWQRTGDRDGKAIVFVVGLARDVVDSHVAAVRAAGLQPVAADLRIIAAARAIGQRDAIVACIEDEEIEVGIFRDGVPAIVRYVAMSAPCGEPAWTAQLAEELNRTIKFYRDSHREERFIDRVPVSLIGGAARQAILGEGIAEAIGHAVEMPQLVVPMEPEERAVRFAVNAGLAVKREAA